MENESSEGNCKSMKAFGLSGADEEIRTLDLLITNQLSRQPTGSLPVGPEYQLKDLSATVPAAQPIRPTTSISLNYAALLGMSRKSPHKAYNCQTTPAPPGTLTVTPHLRYFGYSVGGRTRASENRKNAYSEIRHPHTRPIRSRVVHPSFGRHIGSPAAPRHLGSECATGSSPALFGEGLPATSAESLRAVSEAALCRS